MDHRIAHQIVRRARRSVLAGVVLLMAACGSESPAGGPALNVTPPASSTGAPTAAGNTAATQPTLATGAAGSASLSAMPVKPAMTPMSSEENAKPIGASTAPVANAEILPCGVSQSLATNCQTCHAAAPIGGAPMALVTYADLHKPAVTQPSMKVYQLAKLRIHDQMRAMPPGIKMTQTDTATLDTWFDAGAPAGTKADATCMVQAPKPGMLPGGQDGTYGRLTPRAGETCYEFKVHQSTASVDSQPYAINQGEHYEQFYYKAPWPKGTVATSYATITDNEKVLHHWLLFSSDENEVEGFHKTAPLPTLIGTNPVLLAGWALGGPNMVPPDDVGMELPEPGKQLNIQWHFYNSTNTPQVDASSIQICTVPSGVRKNTGSITWLGTEDLNGNVWFGGAGMPPHQESTFTSTCNPLRGGMNSTEPIHMMIFEPHMHRIGKSMKTIVNHMDGTKETIFDEPFSFGSETHYYKNYDLKPGETLTTSCTFNNTNDFGVPFGESSDSEMCYQFVYSWPAHALSNYAPSILGVTDTCW
jgi:hypothetical protein